MNQHWVLNSSSKRPGPPQGTTRTIRVDLQYEGTNYVGWQRQAKGRSIQGMLEQALARVARESITLFGASRTDAGVHAHGQVASFSLKRCQTPVEAFVKGTNSLLPGDIRVIKAQEVDLWFHSNRDAREKTYCYFLEIGPIPCVFLRKFVWHLWKMPNLSVMQEASKYVIGKHDFASFRTRGSTTKTSIRHVTAAMWKMEGKDLLMFEITANGFLKHMVRNIVGTLVELGVRKKNPMVMKDILSSCKRTAAGRMAPAQGLFLWNVAYEMDSLKVV